MKMKLWLWLWCLVFGVWNCPAAVSPPPPQPASQAEVDAGLLTRKFVSPATLAGYSLAQSTGSISAATATNIAAYQALIATNRFGAPLTNNDTRSVTITNFSWKTNTLQSYFGGTFGFDADGQYSIGGSGGTTYGRPKHLYVAENITGLNFYTTSGGSFTGNGTGLTNLPVAAITNAGTAAYSNATAFVLSPTNSGSSGQILSLTGDKTKWVDDATGASGSYDSWSVDVQANEHVLYDVAAIHMRDTGGSGTIQSSDGSSFLQIGDGSAGIIYEVSAGDHEFHGAVNITNFSGSSPSFSGAVTANAGVTVANGATSSGVLKIMEDTDAGSNFASFQVPSLAADTVYILPSTDGNSGQYLQTDGSGTLTWADASASSSTFWYTNSAAASSVSNAYNVKIAGNLDVTGTNNTGTAIITNMYHSSYTSRFAAIASDGKFTNSAASADLASTLTDETGDGGGFVRANNATLVAPALGTIASGNGMNLTNLNSDSFTNTFTINSAFPVGSTNMSVSAGSVTGGITGIANGPTSTSRWGELLVVSTGTLVFTNHANIRFSDGLTSRTITNGTKAVISIKVWPGVVTNAAIVHFP